MPQLCGAPHLRGLRLLGLSLRYRMVGETSRLRLNLPHSTQDWERAHGRAHIQRARDDWSSTAVARAGQTACLPYLGGSARSENAVMDAPPVRRLLRAAMAVSAAAFCEALFWGRPVQR